MDVKEYIYNFDIYYFKENIIQILGIVIFCLNLK